MAASLLADLQRLQAEYVNYKKRVDRDRDVIRNTAVGGVVESLLPVLDDIHMARQAGDLADGPFSSIADKLEATLGRFGVERVGEAGQEFDPNVHEALMHVEAELPEGTTATTVVQVLQPGYRIGDRLVRARGCGCRPAGGCRWAGRGPAASHDVTVETTETPQTTRRRRCDEWLARTGSRRTSTRSSASPRRRRRDDQEGLPQARATSAPRPQVGDTNAEERFKGIGEAYAVLSDPEQRKEYDAIRSMAAVVPGSPRVVPAVAARRASRTSSATFGRGRRGGGPRTPYRRRRGRPAEPRGHPRPDVRWWWRHPATGAGGFGGYGPRPDRARGGRSAGTRLPFRDAVAGSTVTLSSPDLGRLTARIPAGVKDGQKIRLRGRGSRRPGQHPG